MKIICGIKNLAQKLYVSENALPFFYRENNLYFFLLNDIVIPFSTKKIYFLKYCRIEFYPLKENVRLSSVDEKKILNEFVIYIKQHKIADRIVSPSNYVFFSAVPDNATWCGFGTYQIDLALSEEQLWNNIHSKHRNVIRNAERNKVVLKYGKDQIESFYSLYKETMQRSGMHCEDISHFKNIYMAFPESTICGVAYYNNAPQGAIFMPYSLFGAFYLYGASASKIEVNGAMNYLHWNTIKFLKHQNVKLYDFVGARLSNISGTRLEGIQKFKERFGAELKRGYLWKIDISKTKCFVYDFLLRLKATLKGAKFPKDIIDQENEKEKYPADI